jgi:hypothetical protein
MMGSLQVPLENQRAPIAMPGSQGDNGPDEAWRRARE